MAKFPNITMTSAGLEMLARAASGQTADRFIVTKVKLGDGVSEGNIRDYTDIISSKKEVTLASFEDKGNGTFRYTFTYNNEGVKVGFYHREIGLFAKNGDSGTEKLVGYTNAGNYAGYIDDETRIQPYTRLMINVGVGDTDNASGMVDVGNTVTIEMLDEHNNNENAHTNLIKRLFGSATATMESVNQKIEEWAKDVCLPLSGGTLTGNLNANGHNVTATKFIGNLQGTADEAKNINGGYDAYNGNFPSSSFKEDVLNRTEEYTYAVRPFTCKFPDSSNYSNSGVGFTAHDTIGFLQVGWTDTKAFVGGGAGNTIRWYKELAFKDNIPSAVNTMMVKPAMMMMSENDIVGTGWTKNIDGVITQIMEVDLIGQEEIDIQYPVSFPEKCLFLDVEIINVEKDTSINCNFHTIEKTVDGAKLLKVGTGSPKKIIVKVTGI